jgi:hypothetical protein
LGKGRSDSNVKWDFKHSTTFGPSNLEALKSEPQSSELEIGLENRQNSEMSVRFNLHSKSESFNSNTTILSQMEAKLKKN